MTRMLGLGVDSVLQFTIVTAEGEIATATSTCMEYYNNETIGLFYIENILFLI